MNVLLILMTMVLAVNDPTVAAPAGARPEPLTGAFDPAEVLVQLEQAIAARDWRRYSDLLAADYRFIPYSALYQEYPALDWGRWDRKREIRFIEELVSPSHRAALVLGEQILEQGRESQGRAEWDLVYRLTTRGQEFRSRAVFVFAKVHNRWFLREWIDTTIETDADSFAYQTSGSLRGVLSR